MNKLFAYIVGRFFGAAAEQQFEADHGEEINALEQKYIADHPGVQEPEVVQYLLTATAPYLAVIEAPIPSFMRGIITAGLVSVETHFIEEAYTELTATTAAAAPVVAA